MKTRMATRFSAKYPDQPGHWHGTCPTWARQFPIEAVVTSERILVVNPTTEPCAFCNGAHVRLPAKEA